MDSGQNHSNSNLFSSGRKRLTWTQCSVIVLLTMSAGVVLNLWRPLLLAPPRLAATGLVYAGQIITVAAIGFLLILGYGLRSQFVSPIGAPAPDFTFSLFDGGEISLADRRGLVVVVNFWASWCPPCRDEATALERVWREYEDKGVVFVGRSFCNNET